MKYKVFRITTVPQSLHQLLKPQLDYLKNDFEIITAAGPYDQENIDIYGNWEYKHFEIALSRKITPLKDVKAIFQLYKIIRREKINIVHTHTPKAGLIGMLASFLAGVKVRLHTVAGLQFIETTGMKKKVLIFFEKLTYKFSHQVMPNSKGVYDYIVQNNLCNPGKLKILANGATIGINLNRYKRTAAIEKEAEQIKQAAQISSADFICCFIGRLTKQKGIEELISAFQKILPAYSNIKLILLGRYEQHLDPISEEYINYIESNPRVIHFGYQLDVRPYLAISHLFVFPSYREGLPNVVLQAGSFDLPSIVTDIAGSNEIIQDEYNGLIVPSKDADSLTKAVIRLIEDEKLRLDMKKHARELIEKKYDQVLILEALKQEYINWIHEKNI